MDLNKVPVSMKDPCPSCHARNRWEVIPTTVEERMRLRIGRYWLARCKGCQKEFVVLTHKQEKELREKQPIPKQKQMFHRPEKRVSPAQLPDPRLTVGGDCNNKKCDQAFCPEHSPINYWAGGEELLDVPPTF